jgi:gamma-glutamyl phosphate reductase
LFGNLAEDRLDLYSQRLERILAEVKKIGSLQDDYLLIYDWQAVKSRILELARKIERKQ